jgi:hypothetical protein
MVLDAQPPAKSTPQLHRSKDWYGGVQRLSKPDAPHSSLYLFLLVKIVVGNSSTIIDLYFSTIPTLDSIRAGLVQRMMRVAGTPNMTPAQSEHISYYGMPSSGAHSMTACTVQAATDAAVPAAASCPFDFTCTCIQSSSGTRHKYREVCIHHRHAKGAVRHLHSRYDPCGIAMRFTLVSWMRPR